MACLRRAVQALGRAFLAPAPPAPAPAAAPGGGDHEGSPATQAALPGADDVLPLLILAVKDANPPALHSQVKYLHTYLARAELASEPGYLLTQLASAVSFLEHVDAAALTIAPGEYDRALAACKKASAAAAAAAAAAVSQEAVAAGVGKNRGARGVGDGRRPPEDRVVGKPEAAGSATGSGATRSVMDVYRRLTAPMK